MDRGNNRMKSPNKALLRTSHKVRRPENADVGIKYMNQAPYGYEHRKLPELNRSFFKLAGTGILLSIVAITAWFALEDFINLILRTSLAVFILVIGQSIFWKYFRRTKYCPQCGRRFSNTVEEDYRTILLVCEQCQICWDTGVIQVPSAGISE